MLLRLLLLALCWHFSAADIFTSIAHMEALQEAEKFVPKIIESYVKSEITRLENLRRFAAEYQKRNQMTIANGLERITNPISAFLLIKELLGNWQQVEDLMKKNEAQGYIQNMTLMRNIRHIRYPTEVI
ncbi:unnamed protein product [Anisakis simplex]|uniref:Prolyl 4-hydroxylase subunit alpha-1 (inferred by orthology to a C. elegans protein) n=1 Tax=Anisakis simplex TaxID=6269 RepID=A0A0M3JCP1_ANISI|nr:unnamed protein product [Anisakis simplex]